MTQVGLEFIARDRSRTGLMSFQRTMSQVTRTVLRFAGVGGGLYLMQRGLRDAVNEASRSQETMAKFNVVFREQAAESLKWAEDFGNTVGRSTQDVAEWMAGLQDTFVPLGIARDKAAELSKSLVQLAVDVASFNNKADADVIRDFTSALVGNHETVRKYGIIISESAIKQEALNQGLNKTYKELTDLEKVQLRYKLIQRGSTDAQGDALRTADSYANQIKRLRANYQELSATIGQQLIPELADLIKHINKLAEGGNLKALFHENIAVLYEFGDAMTNLDELFKKLGFEKWKKTYRELADEQWELARRARAGISSETLMGKLPINEVDNLNKRLREVAQSNRQMADSSSKANADIVADTREKLASIRAMDYMTRMEKIQNLKIYMAMHADTLSQVAEAEKLLNDEIIALQYSRMDAMKVYAVELREDMQDSNLYISEKFAQAARSIENSMAGAFESMITEGASWRDAMNQFFSDVARAFARMAAEMAARQIMASIMGSAMGGVMGGGYYPNYSTTYSNAGVAPAITPHEGGIVGEITARRNVPISTFIGASRLHRGLGPNEFPAILERGEKVIPKDGGEPTIVNNITIKALDSQDVQRALAKEKNFIHDLNYAGLKSNHPQRRFER